MASPQGPLVLVAQQQAKLSVVARTTTTQQQLAFAERWELARAPGSGM